MDLARRDEEGELTPRPRVFINPEILSASEELSVYEEGCLSIPEYYEEVERPARVRIRFTDLDGKVYEEDAEGIFATCIQHEIDHLNGVLFVDYLSKLKRDRVLKRFTKAAKLAGK
jgi:peptide deformylase